MSDKIRIETGTLARDRDALYAGEVAADGARIRVWATPATYGIVIAAPLQEHGVVLNDRGYHTDTEVVVHGDTRIGIGPGLSCEQAEALIIELALAVAAKRQHDGEPWHGGEIAPGILRAPEVSEG